MTARDGGLNVAVVSRHASRIDLCIFDASDVETHRFPLQHRLGEIHYAFVEGFGVRTRYGFRAEGPWDEAVGHHFDSAKLLIDPYATSLDRPFCHVADLTRRGTDTASLVPKAIVEADFTRRIPLPPAKPGLIYEIPVKAFTMMHPAVPEEKRGTVAALAEPAIIDHLMKLGVDTVELMPLAAWIDERHLPPLKLSNGWGYNPVTFMAPDPRIAPGGFEDIGRTVDALHKAGIRVILDVVFNHTGESDERGATLSLRGLDNALYYAHADGRLVNDTGCGNTLALDRAPVMRLAMDAMRCWVERTGIDGFRFDLATVMGREATGFSADAPLLAAIEQDPLLSRLIMIAEPWDIGPGGYRLGQFPARWHEWNDHYRDDVRRFWRGDSGTVGTLATRLAGSSDVFGAFRRPSASVNFIAAHDGFTLKDVVTYSAKDNVANGENNRDGNGSEVTWPGGDARVLLATLFFSLGTPMLTAGDEFGRSQRGNNNAYAQDNELTWLDWRKADHRLTNYVSGLVALRRRFPQFGEDRFLNDDARWYGSDGNAMDWHDPKARGLSLVLMSHEPHVAICINGSDRTEEFRLPHREGWIWRRVFCSAEGANLPAWSVSLYVEARAHAHGISDDGIRSLAADAGIEQEWWEVDGTHHRVSIESLRALLKALHIPFRNTTDLEEARRLIAERRKILVGREGKAVSLGAATAERRRLRVTDEQGETQAFDVPPGTIPMVTLEPGRYVVESEAGDLEASLIVAPQRCYMPEDLKAGHRVFGLSAHLYALRHQGDGGIGDFETLRRYAELNEKFGGRYAGLNPLHHLFPSDRSRASPYQPSDRRFIDPIYINLDLLLRESSSEAARALAATNRAAFANLETLAFVDYAAVWKAKGEILERLWTDFQGDPDFDRFTAQGGAALEAHGTFEAGRAGETPSSDRIRYRAFLQWMAERQLERAAEKRNLYRDLALGCAFDGGEIADAPDIFAAGVSIGAPPDPFSRDGQVWNLPPFSPLALIDSGLQPMADILSANMRHAAALRIDHVLGFMRQFWVPRGEEGKTGAYVRFPLEALMALTALESERHRCLVIGEDLGTVPDGLREAMDRAGMLSYRVLWFERDGRGFRRPQDYPARALACLASHDLPTFMGWHAGRDIAIDKELGRITSGEAERRTQDRKQEIATLAQQTHAHDASAANLAVAAHRFVASAPSLVMLAQVDDLAGVTEPLNVPGTDTERPNWRRRIGIGIDEIEKQPLARAIIEGIREERP